MSIFTKDCPVCAASHPVHSVRCGCGYCFDPNKLDGVTQELEVISQEETLYRDYLAARVDQSEGAWQKARVTAARNPDDRVKTAEALLAEQNAMAARAEFDAQVERAKAVKNRIKVVRSNRRARRVAAPVPTPRPAPVAVREVFAPKPSPIAAPPKPVDIAPAPVVAPVAKPTPSAKPAPTPTTVKKASHRPVISPRAALSTNVAPPAKPTPVRAAAPVVAPMPPRAPVPSAPVPVVLDKPTPSFRASQANKAERLAPAPARPPSQECPNCSGKLPLNAKRCRCGFELPLSASQMPSLAMSPEDRAAFLAALAPPVRNSRS